jgi:hypothetical protein
MKLRPLLLAASLALVGGVAASQAPGPAASPVPATTAAPGAPAVATAPSALPGGPPPAKNLLPMKDVMRHIVNPAAELYWKAGGEVDDAAGEHHRVPTADDDARWSATLDAAETLQEAGNLLMIQGRARDNGRWMKYAQQLSDAGALAIAAAQARDETKTFAAGSALYDACFNCHGRYIPRPANSLYQHLNQPDSDFKPPK